MIVRSLCIAAVLLAAPLARADECRIDLGQGWPPATENYGSAVEKLLTGEAQPKLTLTQLPARGVERGLQLVPGEGAWTLRYAVADERVSNWTTNGKGGVAHELRVAREPEVLEVPIPEALAQRIVAEWHDVLAAVVPANKAAAFHEGDIWLLMVNGMRVSGLKPGCGPAEQFADQIDLLIEAVDEGAEKRERRWVQLGESLDAMRVELLGAAGDAAGESNGND